LAGGVVLTARHVLDGAATATVDVPGLAPLVAPVVAVDAGGRDAAILRLPPSVTFSAATVAGRAPAPATPVAVLGHVRGGTTQRRSGAVVGFVTTGPLALDGGRVMTVDVAFEPGMSGGPVVDTAGRVVGVAIGVERNSGTGIAVPVDELEALLDGEGDPPSPGCGESR
jgi:S1-C subfamily serine protease